MSKKTQKKITVNNSNETLLNIILNSGKTRNIYSEYHTKISVPRIKSI